MIGVTRRRQRDPKKQNQTKRMVSHNEVRAVSKRRSFSLRRRDRHLRYKGKLRVLTTGDPLLQIHKDFREKLPPKWGPNGNLGTGGLFLCYAATLSGNKIFLFSVVTIVECGEELSVEKIGLSGSLPHVAAYTGIPL